MKALRIIAVYPALICALLFFPSFAVAQEVGPWNPTEYNFGDVGIGDCRSQIFTVPVAVGPLNFIGAELIADSPPIAFQIVYISHEPGLVSIDESIIIEIAFCPTQATIGSNQAWLRIMSDALVNYDIRIPLIGNGVSSRTREFILSGIEIVKGIDIIDIRYGTTFLGKAYEGGSQVGNWYTVIRHTDTENIEVCGGTNNLLKVKLVVNLNEGSLAGNRLVLGLQNPVDSEDVVWDAMAPLCGPACYDEDCVCPSKPDLIEPWNCAMTLPEDYGPVATIENLELKQKYGTTLDIEGAFLTGWLCHNWAFIPRVTASLTIVLDD
jgi:hypothetical protein